MLFRSADERVRGELLRGHTGQSLVQVADDLDADLVVVGHRGDGRISLMLGSTANYVVHHTVRPVVVMRGEVTTGVVRRVVILFTAPSLAEDCSAMIE